MTWDSNNIFRFQKKKERKLHFIGTCSPKIEMFVSLSNLEKCSIPSLVQQCEKVHLLLSLTSKSATYLFRAVLACKQCLIGADFSPDSDQNTFSLEEALLWIMDSYFGQKQQFEVKKVLMMDLFQLLSSQDVNWWTGVVWIIVMFLSAVWTLILTAPIHCRGSIAETVMQCYISPNLMKKQTYLHLEWPKDEYMLSNFFFFGELSL